VQDGLIQLVKHIAIKIIVIILILLIKATLVQHIIKDLAAKDLIVKDIIWEIWQGLSIHNHQSLLNLVSTSIR